MVKKLSKFLAYTLFFIFALMVFIPKSSLYYLLEENMKKFDIVISKETLQENIFSLKVQNLEISFKDIHGAVIEEADITLLFFYNSLKFENIKLSSLLEAYLPAKIQELQVTYTIFKPLLVKIEAEGEFGEMQAEVDILERNLSIKLQPTNIMLKQYKKSIKMFKKSQEGDYVYAKSF